MRRTVTQGPQGLGDTSSREASRRDRDSCGAHAHTCTHTGGITSGGDVTTYGTYTHGDRGGESVTTHTGDTTGGGDVPTHGTYTHTRDTTSDDDVTAQTSGTTGGDD